MINLNDFSSKIDRGWQSAREGLRFEYKTLKRDKQKADEIVGTFRLWEAYAALDLQENPDNRNAIYAHCLNIYKNPEMYAYLRGLVNEKGSLSAAENYLKDSLANPPPPRYD